MPRYTLDELIEKMEPQAQRNHALIRRCIDGLGLYAAQIAEQDRQSSKIDKMRMLAEQLVSYWGLNDASFYNHAKPLEEYMDDFDVRVDATRTGGNVTGDVYQSALNVIYGLYCYGEDMISSQGADAMSEILDMRDLMIEIGTAWDFEPEVIDGLSARLTAEVRTMLKNIPLPGHSVSGVLNAGYEITQAVMFENGMGIALAHHPDAPSPFVTWRFGMDAEGGKWYEWGHYFSTEERVKIDYISRVTDYAETHKITEKPFPTADAELDAEQNYNMLDGVQNNIAVPALDLTDGQTFEEMQELGPEMLTVDADNGIDVRVMSENQPLVTVTHSEDATLCAIVSMPLYLANTLFFEADEQQSAAYVKSGYKGAPSIKTDFRIDFTMNGVPDSYTGTYDIGAGDGTLVEQLQDSADYYRNDDDYQDYLALSGEKESANARYDKVLNELVPYFEKHCELSRTEAYAVSELMSLHDASVGNPSESEIARIAYLEGVVAGVWFERYEPNGTMHYVTAERSNATTMVEADAACNPMSVLGRIKAARETPQEPRSDTPTKNKGGAAL